MYIRTKDDAIYEIANGNIIIGNLEVQIDSRKAIEEGNIIADSIEKLCDGFYNDILNDFDCFGLMVYIFITILKVLKRIGRLIEFTIIGKVMAMVLLKLQKDLSMLLK